MTRFTFASVLALAAAASSASAQTIYFSDFEGTNGGFVAGGVPDWERGVPAPYAVGTTSGNGGINAAFSGAELWATNLDGPHANSTPGAAATLTQTFDFTGVTGPVTLTFQHYLNSGGNTFDFAEVRVNNVPRPVNGTAATRFDGTEGTYTAAAGVTFAPATIDLTPFAGQAGVALQFYFFETTVVQRDGWYVDDVRITGTVPEPTALAAVAGAAGLALVRRRARRS